jgi:glycosyltransferase involved in cell wall biosynthesis
VLTTVLNPPAREAVRQLALEAGGPRWIAWCEDVSAVSAFVDRRGEPDLLALRRAGVRFVTISEARRRDLYTVYGLPASDVEVVEPPVDSGLLGLDEAALRTARALGVFDAFPVVLVPAKLAVHKRLDRAVELAAWLDQTCARSLVLVTGTPSVHQPEMSANVADALSVQSEGVAGFVVLSTRGVSLEAAGLRTLMQLSDVVYVPSDEEGYGLPAAEAAALGVPVVCSDIPAFRESGAGWARYVSRDAGAEEVARLVLEWASAPGAQARRRAVRSSERFRAATLRLACYPNV